MKSNLPKVLHPVAGMPIVEHVIRALLSAGVSNSCLVLGPDTELFQDLMRLHQNLPVCIQGKQMGTGDAVASAAAAIAGAKVASYTSGSLLRGVAQKASYVLICAGDTPALKPEVIKAFVAEGVKQDVALSVLAMDVPQPFGYGRIVCDPSGNFERIVEEKDASDEQKKITVCNSGVILARASLLFELLASLKPNNSQNEYYLTDTLGMAAAGGKKVTAFVTKDWRGFLGVNDRQQLATVEGFMIEDKIKSLMGEGVSFALPGTSYVEMDVRVGVDTQIGANVSLAGKTVIGRDCRIEAGVSLRDCTVGDGAIVGAGAVLVGRAIVKGERIAPLTIFGG